MEHHTLNNINKQDQVVLITGAARRIGASIASHFHALGYGVIIHYHQSSQEAHQLTDALNQQRAGSAFAIGADLRIKNSAEELIAQSMGWKGRLDHLINNASVFMKTDLHSTQEQDWETLFIVNVQAPFWLSLAAHPHIAQQFGSIVNITDIHSEKPLKDYAWYCQSKAAFTMQTKVLAKEFAPHVRVNAVAPGTVIWPEGENTLSESLQQKIMQQTLLKKRGDPIYIAQAVAALAENAYITGQTIRVDAGRILT